MRRINRVSAGLAKKACKEVELDTGDYILLVAMKLHAQIAVAKWLCELYPTSI